MLMHSQKTLLISLFLFLTIGLAESSDPKPLPHSPLPLWIEPVSFPEELHDASKSGDNIHYILVSEQYNLTEQPQVRYYEEISVPLTSDGLQDEGRMTISYNPVFQEISFHKFFIKRGNDTINLLDQLEMKLLQREQQLSSEMYNGNLTASILIPDLHILDTLHYGFTTTGKNTIFGDKSFISMSTSWGIEVDKVYKKVIAPKYRSFEISPDKSLSYSKKRIEKTVHHEWVGNQIEAELYEKNTPSWFSPYNSITLTEYMNWSEVVEWALPLYPEIEIGSENLKKHISQWKKLPTDLDKIKSVLTFVQDDIRYFGVEIGENSHRPSHPDTVYQRKYGDCKDKSYLLISILKELGISSAPALVNSYKRSHTGDMLPAPQQFNHVITYINLEGEEYWVDPTKTYQRGTLDKIGFSYYGSGLVVLDGEKELKEITPPEGYRSEIGTQEIFHVTDYESPVSLKVSTTYKGDEADYIRYNLTTSNIEEIQKSYIEYYKKSYEGLRMVDALSFEEDSVNNIVVVHETYEIDNFFDIGEGVVYLPIYAHQIYSAIPTLQKRERIYPWRQTYPINYYHKTDVIFKNTLPELYLPDTVRYQCSDVDFTAHTQYSKNKFEISYAYHALTDAVAPEKYEEYKVVHDSIDDVLAYNLTFPYVDYEKIETYNEELFHSISKLSGLKFDSISPTPIEHALTENHIAVVDSVMISFVQDKEKFLKEIFVPTEYIVDEVVNNHIDISMSESMKKAASDGIKSAFDQRLAQMYSTLLAGQLTLVHGESLNDSTISANCKITSPDGSIIPIRLQLTPNIDKWIISDFQNMETPYSLVELLSSTYKILFGGIKGFDDSLNLEDTEYKMDDYNSTINAFLSFQSGDIFTAKTIFDTLPAKVQESPIGIMMNIQITNFLGKKQQEKLFLDLEKRFENDSQWYYILASHFMDAGNPEKAHSYYSAFLDSYGDDPDLHVVHAGIELTLGNTKDAIGWYGKTIARYPENDLVYWYLFTNCIKNREFEIAVRSANVLNEKFNYTIDRDYLTQYSEYHDFLKSSEFRKWEKRKL